MPIEETTPTTENFYKDDAPASDVTETVEAAIDAAEAAAQGHDPDAADAPEGEDGEATEEAPAKPDKVSAAFTALAKREKKLNRRRAEFDAERQKFESERQTWQQKVAQAEHILSQVGEWKKDPLKALEGLGTDYESLTRRILEGAPQESPEVKAVRQELQALREEMTRREREQFDAQQRAAASAAKNDAFGKLATLSRDENEYPLASRLDPDEAAQAAWQIMDEAYSRTGKIIEFSDAVGYVEEALQERLSKFGVALPSRGGTGRANGVAKAAKPEADAAIQRRKPTTLTQRAAAETSSIPDDWDSRQRDAYIAKMIKWT